MENEYRLKYCNALRLGSKGTSGAFHLWINVWVAVILHDPSLIRAIPECFRDEFLMIKNYADLQLFYFTVTLLVRLPFIDSLCLYSEARTNQRAHSLQCCCARIYTVSILHSLSLSGKYLLSYRFYVKYPVH